ncbi:MAG TPA: patatin-like phospholipase family protein, partial [Nannocystaceae bacterium]|nr:patatin-like phospholipase family protein [Nannocystaceae bacterium]
AATAALVWISTWEQRLLDAIAGRLPERAHGFVRDRILARLDAFDRLQLAITLPMVALWIALSLVEARWPGLPGAFAAVVLSVLTLEIYGFVRYWARDFRVLAYLLLLAAVGVCNVVRFGSSPTVPALVADGAIEPALPSTALPHNPTLLRDVDVLLRWRASCEKPRLLVIATSGGGIRAAAWTAHVLRALEEDPALAGIGRHVRLVTGASGGMVGAAAWVTTMVEPAIARTCSDALCLHGGHDVFSEVAADSLDAVAAHFALWLEGDRGTALERAWIRNDAALARPLMDLAAGERDGWLPSLVFSPMIVENGRRVLIANLDLRALTSTNDPWPDLATAMGPSDALPAFELFALYPDATRFTVATAARLSASFPYVSPFPRLPIAGAPMHLTDAGIYDNYGVDVASRWIAANAQWLMTNTEGVALVQIRDEVSTRSTFAVDEPDLTTRATYPLSGPFAAFFAARESTSAFRNDHAVDVLRSRFTAAKHDGFFQSFAFELTGEVSLSWRLSDAERETIRASLPAATHDCALAEPREDCSANLRELARLRTWWSE